jgi:hypothetical protein
MSNVALYDFYGEDPLGGLIIDEMPFTGKFTFNRDNTNDLSQDPRVGFYQNPFKRPYGITIEIVKRTFKANTISGITVVNDFFSEELNSLIDTYTVEADQRVNDDPTQPNIFSIMFQLMDQFGQVFKDDSLPRTAPDLDLFVSNQNIFFFTIGDYDSAQPGSARLQGRILSID